MHLYFLRHGDADDNPGVSDRERRLSPTGKKQAEIAAQFCRRSRARFDSVLSSPLVRACETAEPFVRNGFVKSVTQTEALLPTSSPAELLAELRAHPSDQLLLVGHQPLLGDCISCLIAPDGEANIEVKKGSLTLVELKRGLLAGTGILRWMLLNEQMESTFP
ncbi:MAG TPA: phosphohistidine phosphatase SixA [Bacteroidota bacterium]|nr:phosphohistidine phosphatase SixA [Bacteroidota bacterium]